MAGKQKRIKGLTQDKTEELMWYLRAVDVAGEDMPGGAWAVNLQQSALAWLRDNHHTDAYKDEGYTIVYDFYLDWRLDMSEKHDFFEIGA